MVLIYDLGLKCYYFAIWIASLFNRKAAQWIKGRKTAKEYILKQLETDKPVIWMHCASLGEFEQGRPIIEAIRTQYPQFQILLTFFSPSGYEIRKNYEHADAVAYLPSDSKQHADWLVNNLPLKLAIFVKYDLWYHYLNALQKAEIPSILVAAFFRKDQFYFKSYGRFMLEKIKGLSTIYVQKSSVKSLLEAHGITQVVSAGDPRVDRVFTICRKAKKYPIVEAFVGQRKVLIAGSTWPEDQAILLPFLNKHPDKFKYIIAPHEIGEQQLKVLENGLTISSIRYSKAQTNQLDAINVLIIDNIGMLASFYQYATVVYIGGGFRTGLHNTLEPAAFGVPILFGPKYQKFVEADALVNSRGAFVVRSLEELEQELNELSDESICKQAGVITASYILENKGATEKIMADVASYLRID